MNDPVLIDARNKAKEYSTRIANSLKLDHQVEISPKYKDIIRKAYEAGYIDSYIDLDEKKIKIRDNI